MGSKDAYKDFDMLFDDVLLVPQQPMQAQTMLGDNVFPAPQTTVLSPATTAAPVTVTVTAQVGGPELSAEALRFLESLPDLRYLVG